LGIAVAPATGCTGRENPGNPTPPTCTTGFVTASGACQEKCDPEKCTDDKGKPVPNNVCVNNQCRLLCSSHAECYPGVQSCLAAKDDTGKSRTLCVENGHQPALDKDGYAILGQGKGCPFGQNDCVAKACPNGLECDDKACGGKPQDCKLDEAACKGFKACNIGKCSDGSRCAVTTCAADQCKPFECLTKGEGDALAFCAKRDCMSDDDCGPGFWCGPARDPHDICGPTCSGGKCTDTMGSCSSDSVCQKGNNPTCGKTLEPCVDAKSPPAGTTFFEGSICMMRKTCLRRDECAACTSNTDCSIGNSDICVNKLCAKFCTSDANCRRDFKCDPAGSVCASTPRVSCASSADCPVKGDKCEPRNACVPRSGNCRAEGSEKFCQSCLSDADCGGPDPNTRWLCADLKGERVCYEAALTKSCMTDADCPTSPSGAKGRCLDETDFPDSAPGQPAYHKCYFPRKPLKNGKPDGYSCWP
jgi:hypothetical protein